MSLTLQPLITQAGLDAIINADRDGVSARITHIGLGGASGYAPRGNETALRQERERLSIHFSMQDAPGRFRVRGRSEPSDLSYFVREVGIFLSDGTLLAIWSDPERPITGRGPGAELEFDFLLALDAAPIGSIEIGTTPGGDKVLALLAGLTARAIAHERTDIIDLMARRALEEERAARLGLMEQQIASLQADFAGQRSSIAAQQRQTLTLNAALTAQVLRAAHTDIQDIIAADAA